MSTSKMVSWRRSKRRGGCLDVLSTLWCSKLVSIFDHLQPQNWASRRLRFSWHTSVLPYSWSLEISEDGDLIRVILRSWMYAHLSYILEKISVCFKVLAKRLKHCVPIYACQWIMRGWIELLLSKISVVMNSVEVNNASRIFWWEQFQRRFSITFTKFPHTL